MHETPKVIRERLLQAVDRAKAPDRCKYVMYGQPCCVVAHYLTFKGVSVDQLERMEDKQFGVTFDAGYLDMSRFLAKEVDALKEMQLIWDGVLSVRALEENAEPTSSGARAAMHRVVDRYFPPAP